MVREHDEQACSSPDSQKTGCCRIEAVVSVDERGQMVLPKDLRERAAIAPGDKLAVVTWETDGEICCIALIKTETLAGMVKNVLGAVLRDVSERP